MHSFYKMIYVCYLIHNLKLDRTSPLFKSIQVAVIYEMFSELRLHVSHLS